MTVQFITTQSRDLDTEHYFSNMYRKKFVGSNFLYDLVIKLYALQRTGHLFELFFLVFGNESQQKMPMYSITSCYWITPNRQK
jgi:hypothetical protein